MRLLRVLACVLVLGVADASAALAQPAAEALAIVLEPQRQPQRDRDDRRRDRDARRRERDARRRERDDQRRAGGDRDDGGDDGGSDDRPPDQGPGDPPTHDPDQQPPGCRNDRDCDDGDVCTGTERCLRTSGTCVAGVRLVCDDGNPCNGTEKCHAAEGCTRGTPPGDVPGCQNVEPCLLAIDGTPCATDGVRCTRDTCQDGACAHTPDDGRCDAGVCTAAACRPDDAGADADGCIATPVGEGQPCTDDGVACTEDVCTGGGCQHVPIDSRCALAGSCASVACVPGSGDPSGCLAGPLPEDGATCSEDGNPCTTDVCEDGTCAHASVERPELCVPLAAPFRQALALGALARGMQSDLANTPVADSAAIDPRIDLAARLEPVAAALELTARTLAGAPDAAPAPRDASPDPLETLASTRARAALPLFGGSRKQIVAFMRLLSKVQARHLLDEDRTRELHRRGRTLLRGTRKLRLAVRRLTRFTETFAR